METTNPDVLFTGLVCFGEIRKGIELMTPGKKRNEFEQ